MPWPVRTPQPTVATSGDAGRRAHVRRQTGAHDGQAPRREQRLTDPDRPDAADADHGEDRDDDVRRQDHGGGGADERGERPVWPLGRPGRPGRRSPAGPRPLPGRTSVISKIMPTGSGAGARNRQATNPNRKSPRDVDPVIRRTSVPVRAAAASSSSGRTMRWRASSGLRAEERDGDRSRATPRPSGTRSGSAGRRCSVKPDGRVDRSRSRSWRGPHRGPRSRPRP